jgi:RNA polymerase sigma factor (sigma-70 family)
VLRNYLANKYDKQNVRKRFLSDPQWEETEYTNETEESILFREVLAFFAKGMQQLPARGKKVYELKELHGLNIHEIAAFMGIANSTVKTHLERATKKIRHFMC